MFGVLLFGSLAGGLVIGALSHPAIYARVFGGPVTSLDDEGSHGW